MENDILKSIELRVSTITLREDGIMQHTMKDDIVVDLDDILEIIEAVKNLSGEKKIPYFSNYR